MGDSESLSVGNRELEYHTIQIQRVYLQYRLIPEFSGLGYHTIQYSSPRNSSTKWHFLIPKCHVSQCHDGIENRNLSLVNSSTRKSGRSPFSFETMFFCYKFYERVVFGHFHHCSPLAFFVLSRGFLYLSCWELWISVQLLEGS